MPRYLKIFQISLYLLSPILVSSPSSAAGFVESLSKASGAFFNKKIVKISEKGVIDLKNTEMTPDVLEKILKELEALPDDEKRNVKAFILNSSYTTAPKLKEFEKDVVSKLLALLPKLPNLVNLELAGLQLDKEKEALLNALEKLKHLQSADLGKNNFDYETAQDIVNTLLPLPDFKKLILKENNLNDQEKEKLKDQFEIWKPSPTGATWSPSLDI
ncbi:MAG: hypothetical protein ACRCYP_00595 [Alphaproteobacteria bacterium]